MFKLIAVCAILFASPLFAEESPQWVSSLSVAEESQQLAIISGTGGSNAEFSFHQKDSSGKWQQLLSAHAYIGKNGWGKTREGDAKTPIGVYTFTQAFGINPNPGSPMGYTKVDKTHYWVGDSTSDKYNQFVSTSDYNDFDKKESEHIIDYKLAYKYCLNISWNIDGIPGKGSAIFLHCYTKNKFTGGCVSLPEEIMRQVVQLVRPDCLVVMDKSENIRSY